MRGRVTDAKWRRPGCCIRARRHRQRGFSIMASDSGSQHRSLAIAAIALGKIVELGLPADPRSYELWYVYATGKNQRLRDEIDAALRGDSALTENDIDRLYAQYISPTRNVGDFDRVASRLNDEVGQVVKMIDAAVSSVE